MLVRSHVQHQIVFVLRLFVAHWALELRLWKSKTFLVWLVEFPFDKLNKYFEKDERIFFKEKTSNMKKLWKL